MNNEKLKPCPFCGGVAEFRMMITNDSRSMSQVKVVCMSCDAESPYGLTSMEILSAMKITRMRPKQQYSDGIKEPNNNKPASHMRGFGDATMNNEKIKQIRDSISNTVSCINSDSGDLLTNVILNGHLKALTDLEAAFLGTIHIHDPCAPVFVSGEHIVISGELIVK